MIITHSYPRKHFMAILYGIMLRTLFQSDLEHILMIEKAVHVSPWTEQTFKACFQSNYRGFVMEANKTLIGFIIISLGVEECHVLNLGVAHAYQRQGYGHQLLLHALNYAKSQGLRIVYLEVRRTNSRAISLYKKLQFQLVGERKGYYQTVSGPEDALIFARSLQEMA